MRADLFEWCYRFALSGCVLAGLVVFASCSVAQDTAARWSALGYPRLPAGFPEDDLTAFEGLNKARGKWTFSGETQQGTQTIPVKGELSVTGTPVGGMFAGWALALRWPTTTDDRAMQYSIMAAPKKTGFQWGLFAFDPQALQKQVADKKPARPSPYEGSWDAEQRTMTWTAKPLRQREEQPGEVRGSFQMVVTAEGSIEFKNAKQINGSVLVIGKATKQTEQASQDETFLSGKHQFESAKQVGDPRIKPYLPPTATDVELFSERGGHFAKYKVSRDDFEQFLTELWKRDGKDSVQERDEPTPVAPAATARFRKAAGWESLKNPIRFEGPTKSNGAMTTFYYDRNTGTVYHDRGYW